MRILLIEDDTQLAAGLVRALSGKGYVVNHVARGQPGLSALLGDAPDIVILDLGLPDMEGLEVLDGLRRRSRDLPVLLLTARGSTDDVVKGLDRGADDYLTKPFDMPELMARLRALERRLGTGRSSEICIGEVCLNMAETVVSVGGRQVELSRREYMLLKTLMENAGRVLTRSSLESRLYPWGEEVASNAVEVHVHHLRRKLGSAFIHTVRGVGYKVAAP